MTTWKQRALAALCSALVLVILSGNSVTLAECNLGAVRMGTLSCGGTTNPSAYGAVSFILEFEANAGDIIAFRGSYGPGGGTLDLVVQDATCATTFASDGNTQLTETALICPFVAPETSTYVLYVSAVGRRFVPFSLNMICLDSVDDCATVPVEERTWGHIKTLYRYSG